jgi:hypothetical protein
MAVGSGHGWKRSLPSQLQDHQHRNENITKEDQRKAAGELYIGEETLQFASTQFVIQPFQSERS